MHIISIAFAKNKAEKEGRQKIICTPGNYCK